jgi:ubiquinone biosynthesis protein UbiJ
MHEVRSELQGLNGRVDRLEQTMVQVLEEQRGLREDMQAMPDRIGNTVIKSLEPFLNRLLDHDDQLKNYENRLGKLENPE